MTPFPTPRNHCFCQKRKERKNKERSKPGLKLLACFFCNPFLLQRHEFFLEVNLAKPKGRAAGAAGICGSSLLCFLSDIGFIAAAAEQDVSEGVRKGEMGCLMMREKRARERERERGVMSYHHCALVSSRHHLHHRLHYGHPKLKGKE